MTMTREQPVMQVLLRTRAGTAEAAAGLRRVVNQMDPLVPVTRVRSLNEVVAASVSAPRSLAILLLSFGALALLIGGVGVYSLIAYVVSWRTREIGIRLALGAMRWQIVRCDCEPEPAACGGRFRRWVGSGCSVDAVLAQLPVRGQRARSGDFPYGTRSDASAGALRGLDSRTKGSRRRSDGDTEKRMMPRLLGDSGRHAEC